MKKIKLINKKNLKFKILGNGEIKTKIDIDADFCSASAKNKIESVGGKVSLKNKIDK